MRVLLFGTFDLLHPGHRSVFAAAAGRGDVFVVVARDENVRRNKGRAPVQDERERAAAVREAAPGATVLLGDPADFLRPIRDVRPDLILLGYDQRMPPGVREEDLPCPVERLPAFEPGTHKSSIARRKLGKNERK
jgi:FAD synthetase